MDPVITDELDSPGSTQITKLQAEIIRERLSDLLREKESKKRYLQNMKKINILKYIQKKTLNENGGVKSDHDQIIEELLMQEDKYLSGKPILEVKKELAFQALCEDLNEKVGVEEKALLS